MRTRAITVLSAAVAALLLTPPAAFADEIITVGENNVTYRRSCNTVYKGGVTPTYAITTKKNNGTCEGHAWLRVYTPSGWTSWVSNPTKAKISSSGGHITRAQHKGCADCKVYSTELRDLD